MHFSSTSRNIHLNLDGGIWLCCECQSVLPGENGDRKWISRRFPLHDNFHVSGDSPKLRYGRDGGYALTDPDHLDRNHVVLIGGTILKARVRARSGSWTDTSMCLDFFLTNMGGIIVCTAPSEYLGASVTMIRVSQVWNNETGHSEVPLTGLCIAHDGQLHASSIDLSLHYVNDNGLWKKKKNGHFGDTATEVGFNEFGQFSCRLKRHGDWGGHISVDLYQEVRNVDGQLTIDDPAGFWDARGEFFRILEEIPILGYGVAVADFARGDPDEAQRAVAECTFSTIVAVASFAATTLLGPVGACLAAAAINTGAMLAREGMKANMGEPSFFTRSVGAAMAAFFFSEFLVIAGIGLDSLVGSYMDMLEEEFVASAIDGMVVSVGTWGAKKGLKTLTKEEFKFLTSTVLDVVKNGGSLEAAQAEVDTRIQQWLGETQLPELREQITTTMTGLGYTWDDETIVDDICKAAVAKDYEDENRLQKVIETTVKRLIPHSSWTLETTIKNTIVADGYLLTDGLVDEVVSAVTKYVYRKYDDLVTRITYLLNGMSLGDPVKVRNIKLGITRIGYIYSNTLVAKLLDMVPDSKHDEGLDEALRKVFEGFPASDRDSLDAEVGREIHSAGYVEQNGDRQKIEDDLIQSGFIYNYIADLRFQLRKLAQKHCVLHRRIMP